MDSFYEKLKRSAVGLKNVLILEDDRVSSKFLSDIISECRVDIAIFTAYDEKEAIQIAADSHIDLFIIDILLHDDVHNDLSGFLFARRIRQDSLYEITPIIFITSVANLELHTYREISCFSYIVKPLDRKKQKKLIDEVEKLLQKKAVSCADEFYYFKINNIYYPVRMDTIIMIKCVERKLLVQTVDKSFFVPRLSMKRLLEDFNKLGNYSLVECRRGVLVNQNYIENVDLVNKYIKLQYVDELIDFGNSKWLSHVREVVHYAK